MTAIAEKPIMKKSRARGKAKPKKELTWAEKYQVPSSVADYGTYERFRQTIGIEVVDEANAVRREVFNYLTLNDRVVDPGGRVVAKGTENKYEHPALDPLRQSGILDDSSDAGRAGSRVKAGVELLRLAVEGRILSRSTATWRAVGGTTPPGISQAEIESVEAMNEMRYLRAKDAVGEADWEMIRSVCIDGVIKPGTKRRRLNNALDLLGEFLLGESPPDDVVRPRAKYRDRTLPAWLRGKMS